MAGFWEESGLQFSFQPVFRTPEGSALFLLLARGHGKGWALKCQALPMLPDAGSLLFLVPALGLADHPRTVGALVSTALCGEYALSTLGLWN